MKQETKEEPKHPKVFSEKGRCGEFDEIIELLKTNKMKQETIEEAAERILFEEYFLDLSDLSDYERKYILKAMFDIAKWQAERMYSEQEVLALLYEQIEALDFYGSDFKFADWFEEHKKKFV